jgi:hypothetical protein
MASERSERYDHIRDYEAVEQSDGSWLHNDDEIFWYNEIGQIHREDGPAVITDEDEIFWYLADKQYEFGKWLKETPISDEEKMLLRLQYD